ncbi:MAG: hypothetical protein IT561_14415 [Alphaproteobacteria bacterium]|nr:hypothetical protein [Alphaproteobacteria bacterium]
MKRTAPPRSRRAPYLSPMMPTLRRALVAAALATAGCGAVPAPAGVPPEESYRLATDGECRAATPGNRLPHFRCRGDYDSFD